MATTTIATTNGPRTVTVTEPVPGLHIYKIPTDISPLSNYRWVLAHHEGSALASFESEDAATSAAHAVGPLANWTRSQMTTANEISLGGRVQELMDALQEAGEQHPNA
ncbi:hypothetical protein ACH4JS_26650 [Streptomyces sp. NPDC017638]|uniref:hypothetical protein n=1 Tax=Streptomyces sp. NPDC017638 TaxID=3365004 RepID=UPI0037B3E8F0